MPVDPGPVRMSVEVFTQEEGAIQIKVPVTAPALGIRAKRNIAAAAAERPRTLTFIFFQIPSEHPHIYATRSRDTWV